MKVKEMNKQERPREKALSNGVHSLANRELIAILLRSGTKDKSALELADEILRLRGDLLSLMDLHIKELMQIKGIKEAKATELLVCFELIKRISLERMKQEDHAGHKPQVVSDWLMNHIGHKEQEVFVVLFLNQRGEMIAHKDLFIGTVSKSFANPREVFKEALQYGCSQIICAHNHPSGNVNPSQADVFSADTLEQSGEIIGIRVFDHLIISRNSYFSFREHFMMREQRLRMQETEIKQIHKKRKPGFPE